MLKLENFNIKNDMFSDFHISVIIGEKNLIFNVENWSEFSIVNQYAEKITLKDFQKVKYFLMYDSVKDCFYDIFRKNDTKNISIKEEETGSLVITFPIENQKYASISFKINKIEPELDYEKIIKQQNEIINGLKKKCMEINDKLNWVLDNAFYNINIKIDEKIEQYTFKYRDSLYNIIDKIKNAKKIIKKDNESFRLYYDGKMLSINTDLLDKKLTNGSTFEFKSVEMVGNYL